MLLCQVSRFYGVTLPELLAMPWRLARVYVKHLGRLQAQETLRLAWAAAMPYQEDRSEVEAIQREANGQPGRGEARGETSRADLLKLAAATPGGVVVRRKPT